MPRHPTEDPEAKRLRLAAQGPNAAQSWTERMQAQFGNPEGPTHGGKRPNAGAKSDESKRQLAEKYEVLPANWARMAELRTLYPNIAEYIEIDLDERRILEFMQVLITHRPASVMWRRTVERHAGAMGIGYDHALPLFRAAQERIKHGTPVETHARLFEVAQHLMAMSLELLRRDGCTPEAIRELRETLKMVGGMAGLGPKMTVALERSSGTGTGGGPAPGQDEIEWLAGTMIPRIEAALTHAKAELELKRDARALEAHGTDVPSQ